MTADTISPRKRSETMSSVRSADTKPEWILRCGLHRMGFRYRLRDKRLPGKPDLVFPRYRTVVFVHGCFWHRHEGCRRATFPKSNREFWADKFARNVERDARTRGELECAGWRVLVVWECELEDETEATLARTARALRSGGYFADAPPDERRANNGPVDVSGSGDAATVPLSACSPRTKGANEREREPAPEAPFPPPPDRKELLGIASGKVRLRVASYKASKISSEE